MTAQEIFQALGVEHLESGHRHCRPNWIQLQNCPFCGSVNYHLGYSIGGGFFVCWKCGGHRTVDTWRLLGASKKQLGEILHDMEKDAAPAKRERTRATVAEPKGVKPMLDCHKYYLRERGFDPKQIESIWGVKGIGLASRLSWRLYIPITYKTDLVSWTTRAIGKKVEQRYVSASAEEECINHKELIYGRDFCRNSIVVVEGPADAWKIGPGAGALFGTAFSTAQVREIASIPNRYVCFDAGPHAQAKAENLCNQLSCFPGVTERIDLDSKDPGEASQHEINLVRQIAKL
jgi:hypothetical protein